MINRGDLFWLELPDQKNRPVVIVSPNFLNEVRNRVVVAPCTSRRTNEIAKTEVLLDTTGLSKQTKVQCQDVGTFQKQHLTDKIRSLTPSELEALDRALLIITGLWN
ncbi:MAG: type II toxin-antitoxin system PemK/MazF family toxin [bacterium]